MCEASGPASKSGVYCRGDLRRNELLKPDVLSDGVSAWLINTNLFNIAVNKKIK